VARAEQPERLKRYRSKRDFAATPEPAPRASAKKKKEERAAGARFVIHEHHARRLHWDLRLERDGALASWALPKGLPEAPNDNRFAAATEDHPLEYLDFEGEIPKGHYGAGKMSIWDSGTYECLKWEPRKVEVALHGERVQARYALFPIHAAPGRGEQGEQPKDWLIHRMDAAADPQREEMPRHLAPMLAKAGELPRQERGWAYEIKWDGVRAIAYSTPGEFALESRNLIEITHKYPELGALARALGSSSAVLDGEIVAFDADGRPSFARLQQRMQLSTREQARRRMGETPVHYMIFDLLWLDGHSLLELPYSERRARLAELGLSGPSWQTPEHLSGRGEELLHAAVEQGLEGLLAKRLESRYEAGRRSSSWTKIKLPGRQEFVLGGWLPGQGRRRERIGALLLGVFEPGGSLRYVGRVGSGFSERELDRLHEQLAPLERPDSPFSAGPRPPRGAVFCEPELVAEVSFTEWTSDASLRHPVYLGLREDKPAKEVVRELTVERPAKGSLARSGKERAPALARREAFAAQAHGEPEVLAVRERHGASATAEVRGRELRLSNLDKVLYPQAAFSKRELIDYYLSIAPVLLGHLEGRPLTLTRWPDGVEAKSFFQKQAPAHRPEWLGTVTLPSEKKPIDYVLVRDEADLVWLANLAAIELHTPLARAEAMARPTMLVFDLDPGAPAGVLECARVALALHGTFARVGLESFVKTSGSKGLQVYVPLNRPDVSYAQTKLFARTVAELLERSEPELVVSRMSKARRTGKVLIDWSQNDAKKTTVCVYSLRATQRPTASTPLAWEELDEALLAGEGERLVFEAAQVLERVRERGDLFAPVLSLSQELPGV
jgi:bifunctional non-homologous end joining protein LigD